MIFSLWLTPEGEPFDGGTHFRKDAFLRKLEDIAVKWHFEQEPLRVQARQLAARVRSRLGRTRQARAVGAEVLDTAATRLARGEDRANGGWSVPKFPRESTILYLLGRWEHDGDAAALASARRALDGMQGGGIHDQAGGGFARYATDARWTTPHFEKMLYNQAWLGRCYLEAYRLTGELRYRRTAEGIFDYVRRDMTAPGGGFYAAEDADSEGEEGLFYLWTPAEVDAVLGAEEGATARAWFGVTTRGNFPEMPGRTILTARQTAEAFAKAQGLSVAQLWTRVDAWNAALTAERSKRVRPERDEKILTDWNGFFIGTLAFASRVLDDPELAKRASAAANFILKELRDDKGRLLHSWAGGKASIPAFLDDYAALSGGLLELHEATGRKFWLDEAAKLHGELREQFRDADGAFTRTGPRHEALLARSKDGYDGAYPSGNALTAWSAVRLWRRTGEVAYRDEADSLFAAFGGELGQANGAAFLLGALDERMRGETGNVARGDSGVVRLTAPAQALELSAGATGRIPLQLALAKGWHVAAIGPVPEPLKATELQVGGALRLVDVDAPAGRKTRLEFIDSPVRLWQGELELELEVTTAAQAALGPGSASVGLAVQVCNDTLCLQPQRLRVELPIVTLPAAP